MMEFHPQKCQVLTITKKRTNIQKDYSIHNIKLERKNSAKYLGVTIDDQINWKEHITNTCKKANGTLSFLRRHLAQCPRYIKAKACEVYVRPTLEYSSNVWDPYQQKNIDQIENIQRIRRAARFVCSQYKRQTSVSTLQTQLNWTSLQERRAKSKVTMIYKANNQMCHIPTEELTINTNRRTRRASTNFDIPRSRTNLHLYSFHPSAIRLWNRLPENIKSVNSLATFK